MKENQINGILTKLNGLDPHIEGSALVSSDGLMIDSVLPARFDEDRVSAMSAALLSLGERAVEELEKGSPEQVTVKGDKGYIILTSAGKETVLIVLTDSSAKLGLTYLYVKNTAKEIKNIFMI